MRKIYICESRFWPIGTDGPVDTSCQSMWFITDTPEIPTSWRGLGYVVDTSMEELERLILNWVSLNPVLDLVQIVALTVCTIHDDSGFIKGGNSKRISTATRVKDRMVERGDVVTDDLYLKFASEIIDYFASQPDFSNIKDSERASKLRRMCTVAKLGFALPQTFDLVVEMVHQYGMLNIKDKIVSKPPVKKG